MTALTESACGGRGGRAGLSVSLSPGVGRPTQIRTPSSWARYGCQVLSLLGEGQPVPAAVHRAVHHRAAIEQRAQVRAGAGPGHQPTGGIPPEDDFAAGDRPGNRLLRADIAARSGDEPATGVLRLRHGQRRRDPSRLGSRQVGTIRSSRGCGTRVMGIGERRAHRTRRPGQRLRPSPK